MPAAHHELATGTGDVTVFTGYTILRGWSIRESAGTAAAATVIIRDGTAATDPIVATIELAANTHDTVWLGDGIQCSDGVFVDRTAGETEGSIWLG
ncbi:hypothetical protein GCM10012275_38310 [Longimycelium tulufanense]|uniref:Uncharacterized protein n=1 Tax=Longimycelium tulufanense TaxID=907463 RepID=A0A8J3CGI0_9PSEU|nr:hypothetical protein [Longimycelium tulufanense]GGM64111.1 hypothetical protein GCM10012275_38310 [Longimycelium tulufanense]